MDLWFSNFVRVTTCRVLAKLAFWVYPSPMPVTFVAQLWFARFP